MAGMLALKLKNAVLKVKPNGLEFNLKNISINGDKRGCSGFITDTASGKSVYVNTEGVQWYGKPHENLFRTAKNLKDYKGGYNQWASDDTIASEIVRLLTNENYWKMVEKGI